jgi:Bacterial PH domain
MFKSLAADALGLSDIGKIVEAKDFDKTDVDDYIFHEDNERIFVVIKSKMDEYCFTNLAFIHLNGNLAVSKKKMLNRYLYKHYPISQVKMETAGTVDLDAELKFKIGDHDMSIDIDKKQIDQIKAIYKALFTISEKCKDIQKYMATLQYTHEAIAKMFVLRELPEQVVLSLPDIINQTIQQVESHYNTRRSEIQNYDFGFIFERYVHF